MICSWFAFLYFLIIGQFGQVFKAKLTRNGEKTTVAVKTLRNNPERIEVENLISELKIMIHLGSHDNIVNVIGACTKRLPDQELYVLVEYCEHGNILDVLRRHKASFRWVMERTIKISLALWLPICIYSHNTTYIESKSKKNFSLQVIAQVYSNCIQKKFLTQEHHAIKWVHFFCTRTLWTRVNHIA